MVRAPNLPDVALRWLLSIQTVCTSPPLTKLAVRTFVLSCVTGPLPCCLRLALLMRQQGRGGGSVGGGPLLADPCSLGRPLDETPPLTRL
uniref:Uncharacterized protein n=1 Tax=Knipowitschia caucasica TaxID=637954 RepID=A0AAV2MPF1_KNICA